MGLECIPHGKLRFARVIKRKQSLGRASSSWTFGKSRQQHTTYTLRCWWPQSFCRARIDTPCIGAFQTQRPLKWKDLGHGAVDWDTQLTVSAVFIIRTCRQKVRTNLFRLAEPFAESFDQAWRETRVAQAQWDVFETKVDNFTHCSHVLHEISFMHSQPCIVLILSSLSGVALNSCMWILDFLLGSDFSLETANSISLLTDRPRRHLQSYQQNINMQPDTTLSSLMSSRDNTLGKGKCFFWCFFYFFRLKSK